MPNIHTDKQYENELNYIRKMFTDMGVKVSDMIAGTCAAFMKGDVDESFRLITADDEIDSHELTINELCVSVIARRQPLGPDLRFIISVQKAIIDLERIADLCVSISERIVELSQVSQTIDRSDFKGMIDAVSFMFEKTREAYFSGDFYRAQEIIAMDREIDAHYAILFRKLLVLMRRDSNVISEATRILSVLSSLERIGDHSKNICQQMYYMETGKDVSHAQHPKNTHEHPRGILFLCVQNSARSQIAEGWAKKLLSKYVTVYSAGSSPAEKINPLAVEVMKEMDIDISNQFPKLLTDIPLGKIDFVITLCQDEVCINLPEDIKKQSWIFTDPSAEKDLQKKRAMFKQVRDGIKAKIEEVFEDLIKREGGESNGH